MPVCKAVVASLSVASMRLAGLNQAAAVGSLLGSCLRCFCNLLL